MTELRQESLTILFELLKTHTLDDLTKIYDLYVKHHPVLPLAILHYGNITKNNPDTYCCRGLIIELLPNNQYKVISHGFDRFTSKLENSKADLFSFCTKTIMISVNMINL